MTIVDLTKARAYADSIEVETAAEWIQELADEVESQARTIDELRASRLDATTKALQRRQERDRAIAERDAAVAGLQELYDAIGAMLREANHLAANHPDPAAAGAAMKILGRFE